MPKIEITRTELVWPGKCGEKGNLILPRRVSRLRGEVAIRGKGVLGVGFYREGLL